MRATIVFAVVLIACGGKLRDEPTACVSPNASRSCDEGGVFLFTATTDDAGATTGTLTSCVQSCPVGEACTFAVGGVFVEGACEAVP